MEHMTAKVSCFARAWHFENNRVHVFADSAAGALLGEEYREIAQHMTAGLPFFFPDFQGSPKEGLRLIVDRQLAPSVLARSAFCEKHLENEVRLGCRQYVLFAAGCDTFAIRNRDSGLSIFELDLPEAVADKREKIEKAGLRSCAVSVPCDLALPSWRENLLAAGYLPEQKAFGSLLGISYYLSRDAFRKLLGRAGDLMKPGSAICFDYPLRQGSRVTGINETLAAGAGEAMQAAYTEQEIHQLLAECGFLVYEHLDAVRMTEQYFAEYNRSSPDHPMEAPEGVCYVLAVRR